MSAEAIAGGVVLVLLVALFLWALSRARKGYRNVQSLMARVDAAAEASADARAAASAQQLVHVAVGESDGRGRAAPGVVYQHDRTAHDDDLRAEYLDYLVRADYHDLDAGHDHDHHPAGGTLGERIRRAERLASDRDRVRSRGHLGPADRGPVTS